MKNNQSNRQNPQTGKKGGKNGQMNKNKPTTAANQQPPTKGKEHNDTQHPHEQDTPVAK